MVFGLLDRAVGKIVELLYLFVDLLSLIVYEAVMEGLMYTGLGLLIMALIIHFIYRDK